MPDFWHLPHFASPAYLVPDKSDLYFYFYGFIAVHIAQPYLRDFLGVGECSGYMGGGGRVLERRIRGVGVGRGWRDYPLMI